MNEEEEEDGGECKETKDAKPAKSATTSAARIDAHRVSLVPKGVLSPSVIVTQATDLTFVCARCARPSCRRNDPVAKEIHRTAGWSPYSLVGTTRAQLTAMASIISIFLFIILFIVLFILIVLGQRYVASEAAQTRRREHEYGIQDEHGTIREAINSCAAKLVFAIPIDPFLTTSEVPFRIVGQ